MILNNGNNNNNDDDNNDHNNNDNNNNNNNSYIDIDMPRLVGGDDDGAPQGRQREPVQADLLAVARVDEPAYHYDYDDYHHYH